MDGVGLSNIAAINNEQIAEPAAKQNVIILKDVPDTFEKKPKATAAGIALAGAGSISVGTGSYKFAKNNLDKAINGIDKELQNFCKDINKSFNGIPNNLKAALKYGGALIAGIGAALLIFKDSDKDGKLDIIESLQKFVSPD